MLVYNNFPLLCSFFCNGLSLRLRFLRFPGLRFLLSRLLFLLSRLGLLRWQHGAHLARKVAFPLLRAHDAPIALERGESDAVVHAHGQLLHAVEVKIVEHDLAVARFQVNIVIDALCALLVVDERGFSTLPRLIVLHEVRELASGRIRAKRDVFYGQTQFVDDDDRR